MLSSGDSREVIEIVTATSLLKIAVPIQKIIHHESSTGVFPPSITRGCCRIRRSPHTDFHTRPKVQQHRLQSSATPSSKLLKPPSSKVLELSSLKPIETP